MEKGDHINLQGDKTLYLKFVFNRLCDGKKLYIDLPSQIRDGVDTKMVNDLFNSHINNLVSDDAECTDLFSARDKTPTDDFDKGDNSKSMLKRYYIIEGQGINSMELPEDFVDFFIDIDSILEDKKLSNPDDEIESAEAGVFDTTVKRLARGMRYCTANNIKEFEFP